MIGRIRRIVGYGSMLAGAALLVYAASVTLRARVWQDRHSALFIAAPEPGVRAITSAEEPPVIPPPRRGEPLARLRIPRLGIETVIVEGADPANLALGPGHLEGSALPGSPDNCIIAGHRDGPFGRLRLVRQGDVLEIAPRAGLTARYRVESVEIVDKEDTRPLAPSHEPLLTLVTCYPFHYVGPAPERFVVRALLFDDVDLPPDMGF